MDNPNTKSAQEKYQVSQKEVSSTLKKGYKYNGCQPHLDTYLKKFRFSITKEKKSSWEDEEEQQKSKFCQRHFSPVSLAFVKLTVVGGLTYVVVVGGEIVGPKFYCRDQNWCSNVVVSKIYELYQGRSCWGLAWGPGVFMGFFFGSWKSLL